MFVADTRHSPYARLRPVPLDAVTLTGGFWASRLKTLRQVTLPTQLEQLEGTGRLDNFRRAAGWTDAPRRGFVFDDSDVYKWLEAAALLLSPLPAGRARGRGDEEPLLTAFHAVSAAILAAQQPDGYLNTAFMGEQAAQRWANLRDLHELYCAGHFIQAALAASRASPRSTGGAGDREGEVGDALLQAALRLADLICATFGPSETGRRPGVPGHQEIEIALIELYRLTRNRKYLEQAQFFLDARGHGLIGGSPYHQDHKPYRELDRLAGHAVRALYMNVAAADLYAETGDATLLQALTRLWEHTTARQMYVTGGLGARHAGESFGDDYELPNRQAYAETCAAIASLMWNYRMLLLTGDARFADLLEHTLYNAALPGLSLDGQRYFYTNPLASEGEHRRQPWFACACCPPNLARLLASLPGYFYSLDDENTLWIHLYAENTLRLTLPDGAPLALEVHTSYPWQGDVTLTTRAAGAFALRLRLPAWCADPALTLNGSPLDQPLLPGSYVELRRTWADGDAVSLHLPMPVRYLEAHPAVAENHGKVAVQRGPLLYCLESADQPEFNLDDLYLDLAQPPSVEHHPSLPGQLTALRLPAAHRLPSPPWQDQLYRPRSLSHARAAASALVTVTAIPYFAWANRQPGQLRVWLKAGGLS